MRRSRLARPASEVPKPEKPAQHGRNLRHDDARQSMRVEILKALADASEPLMLTELWGAVGAPPAGLHLVIDAVTDLINKRLIETTERQRTPHGTRTHYELTAKGAPS